MAERIIRVKLVVDAPASNETAANKTAAALGNVADKADKGGSSLLSFGTIAKTAIVAGVGIATKSVLDLGMAYERSLNTLQAVSGASAEQMHEVSDAAKALGNDVSISGASAADAAAAMTELAKGGLTVQESMDAARGTLQLAAAAQIDGAQAAGIQSAALNTFGLAADQAGRVADVLANAANASSGEITDFAAGLAQSGLAAKAMGISVEDTATTLALFANNGLSGSDAGTSFKTMLVSLSNPSKQAAAALEELGVVAFDAQGNFVGMRTVTDQLSAAQARMSTEQFNAAAATAFGTDALRAAVAVAESGTDGFDKMSAAIGKTGGAADLAAANSKGLSGAVDLVKNAAETAALTLFESLSPALDTAVRGIGDMVPVLAAELTPALSTVGLAFVDVVEALLPLIPVLVTALAPALASAAEAIAALAKDASPLIATLGTLFGSVMAAAVPVLSALFAATAAVAGVLLSLPGPVLAFSAALITVAVLRVPLAAFWASMVSGTQTMYLNMLIARGGATGLAAGFATMRAAGVSAMTALKGAFLSNPIGLAIVGITTAIALFSDSAEDATPPTAAFANAVDDATGALKDNAQATIAKELADRGSLQSAAALGISAETYTKAILGQPAAIKEVQSALAAATEAAEGLNDAQGDGMFKRDYVKEAADATAKFRDDQGALAAQVAKTKFALDGASDSVAASAAAMGAAKVTQDSYVAGLEGVASRASEVGTAVAAAAPSTEDMAAALKSVGDTASEADTKVQFLQLTLDALAGRAPDQEKAARAAQAAIRGYVEVYQGQAEAARGVEEANDKVTAAQISLTEAQDKDTDSKYSAEQKALDVAAAARALADAQDGVTTATNGVADASDDLFESGQTVYQGFLQQTQAAYDNAIANGDVAGAQGAAAGKAEELREAFVAQMTPILGNAQAAEDLATQLGLVPSDVTTQVVLNGADAAKAKLQELIDLKIGDKTFKVTAQSTNNLGTGIFGTPKAYTGGLAGTLVGLPGYAGGGLLPGQPPRNPMFDNLLGAVGANLIRIRSGEFIQPQPAVDYYGVNAMQAIQQRKIPKSALQGYAAGGMPSGMQWNTPRNSSTVTNNSGGNTYTAHVHVASGRVAPQEVLRAMKELERTGA